MRNHKNALDTERDELPSVRLIKKLAIPRSQIGLYRERIIIIIIKKDLLRVSLFLTRPTFFRLLCRDRSDANVTRFIGYCQSPARKRQCFDGVWMKLFPAAAAESRGASSGSLQHLDSSIGRVPRCARRGNPRLRRGAWIWIRSRAHAQLSTRRRMKRRSHFEWPFF